jgi:toxin YoeB
LANAGQKTLRKVNALLKDIDREPYAGIGKPEALKGNLQGYWGRRIDEANRVVYRVADDRPAVEIVQCQGHYRDS